MAALSPSGSRAVGPPAKPDILMQPRPIAETTGPPRPRDLVFIVMVPIVISRREAGEFSAVSGQLHRLWKPDESSDEGIAQAVASHQRRHCKKNACHPRTHVNGLRPFRL